LGVIHHTESEKNVLYIGLLFPFYALSIYLSAYVVNL